MEYSKVVGVDKPVSRIVFGTDRLRSRRRWRRWWFPDPWLEKRVFSLLDRSFELGCNSFDTARMYHDAERTLGAWTRARGKREKVVIISKGCHPPRPGGASRLTPTVLSSDLHDSLRAFGGDYFDLYLLHWDDPGAPVEPIVERLDRHLKEGKIRAIGVSNWTNERIAEANAFAIRNGLTPFCASSVQFSLAEWTIPIAPGSVSIAGDRERTAREWYAEQKLSIFVYSSLARGFFSDHYDPKNPDATSVGKYCARHFGSMENLDRLSRAQKLASEQGVTVAQVALAYVLGNPLNMFAIVGCTTLEKLAENVGALSLKLDNATLKWLSSGSTN
jgi:aryl-alcohol dehydrogenase-like predicted oxidoreductase